MRVSWLTAKRMLKKSERLWLIATVFTVSKILSKLVVLLSEASEAEVLKGKGLPLLLWEPAKKGLNAVAGLHRRGIKRKLLLRKRRLNGALVHILIWNMKTFSNGTFHGVSRSIFKNTLMSSVIVLTAGSGNRSYH
jgi:hypothetical protein